MLASASPRNPYVAMLVKSVKSLHNEGTVFDTFSTGGVVADPNPHSTDQLDLDLPFFRGIRFLLGRDPHKMMVSDSRNIAIFTSLNPNPDLFECFTNTLSTSKFSPYTIMTQILGKSLTKLSLCLAQQNFSTVLKMFQNSCKIKSTYSMPYFKISK
jgi:hypothetical protein